MNKMILMSSKICNLSSISFHKLNSILNIIPTHIDNIYNNYESILYIDNNISDYNMEQMYKIIDNVIDINQQFITLPLPEKNINGFYNCIQKINISIFSLGTDMHGLHENIIPSEKIIMEILYLNDLEIYEIYSHICDIITLRN